MLVMPLIVWSGRGSIVRTVSLAFVWCELTQWTSATMSGLAFLLGARLAHVDVRCSWLERPGPQFLGRISYSLYLAHWEVVRELTVHTGHWAILLAIPASIPVAWCVWFAVEQPSINASHRIGRLPKNRSELSVV